MSSKNWMVAGVIVPVVFVAGCLVTPPEAHVRTVPLLLAPPLPPVVVFETEQPYYVQEGYHYHYLNDRWYYARSRSGPWTILPRDRCPREVRYRDGGPRYDAGPGLQVLIAPPLPAIVLFDTEPYYVQEGYHYHYQNNGWYYSRSRNGPWTSLPKDRYPREARYRDGRDKDGRRGDDKGRGSQITQPIRPDQHQEIKKPEHTFGSERNRLDSTSGSQRKPLAPTVDRNERVVTPIPEHRERVQPSKEQKAPVVQPARQHEAVQPARELKPTVKKPVVRKEAVVVPQHEGKSVQPERVQGVKTPIASRSEKTVITPKVSPSQPVVESKDKEGKDQGKKREHSR